MMLWWFLLALGVHLVGGTVALLGYHSNRAALAIGTLSCVLASVIGGAAAGNLLLFGGAAEMHASWSVPIGELRVGVDALSAFFLLCIYLVSGLSAVYGAGYLGKHVHDRAAAPAVFFFSLLAAGMTGVALARDGVLFLIAWELMSLAGFFLVSLEHEKEDVRRASMVYLIASHIGVVFLFILFTVFAWRGGDFSFAALARGDAPSSSFANACFLLALVGFGSKAGFWLLHTWLPDAHPAAPSHVSATMSGVMIKMGIYGFLRALTFLGTPPLWWGILLIVLGGLSGILGILHALAQHDLKRLLAYSSVENVGIVVLGIGLGLLGQSTDNPSMAFLGYAGALLHTLNHGLFKGLLFQGAGSVLVATGTKQIDALGGLSRKMPVTAMTFLVAAIAISGLPPLNGFVSEWLIYVAAFRGGLSLQGAGALVTLAVIPVLALIGGLAAACFVRAYGIPFLGTSRTDITEAAQDPPLSMRVPMVLAAALCVGIGIWPEAALHLVERPAEALVNIPVVADPMLEGLTNITRVALVFVSLVGLLALLRWALLRRREVTVASTWGCGYEAPSPRMQYTAESFAEPVLAPFGATLPRRLEEESVSTYFPRQAHRELHPGDLAGERVIVPVARRLLAGIDRLRIIQHGRVQMYLMYILVTVVAVLLWQLSGGVR